MKQHIPKWDRFRLCNDNGFRFTNEISPNGTSDDVDECALVQEILRCLSVSNHGNKARRPDDLADISEQSSAAISVNKPQPEHEAIGPKGHPFNFEFGAPIG
jgi:hypothetical protein